MTGKSALLIGATGAVGKHVLQELLASKEFTRVGEYGRRVTPKEQFSGIDSSKLEQKTIDFESLEDAGLKDGKWDVVFITLGTNRAAAGSAAAFEKINRDYVVNSARQAKTDEPSHKQKLIYCSSGGANANSPFLYMRSKGVTENLLAGLGYSDTMIFRPGFLMNAERPNKRALEFVLVPLFKLASWVSSDYQIDVSVLGKSILRAGLLGSSALPSSVEATQAKTPSGALFTLIGNKGAEALAKGTI